VRVTGTYLLVLHSTAPCADVGIRPTEKKTVYFVENLIAPAPAPVGVERRERREKRQGERKVGAGEVGAGGEEQPLSPHALLHGDRGRDRIWGWLPLRFPWCIPHPLGACLGEGQGNCNEPSAASLRWGSDSGREPGIRHRHDLRRPHPIEE